MIFSECKSKNILLRGNEIHSIIKQIIKTAVQHVMEAPTGLVLQMKQIAEPCHGTEPIFVEVTISVTLEKTDAQIVLI